MSSIASINGRSFQQFELKRSKNSKSSDTFTVVSTDENQTEWTIGLESKALIEEYFKLKVDPIKGFEIAVGRKNRGSKAISIETLLINLQNCAYQSVPRSNNGFKLTGSILLAVACKAIELADYTVNLSSLDVLISPQIWAESFHLVLNWCELETVDFNRIKSQFVDLFKADFNIDLPFDQPTEKIPVTVTVVNEYYFSKFSKSELIAECEKYGIASTGTKDQMKALLAEHIELNSEPLPVA